jgi:hypothetical protein
LTIYDWGYHVKNYGWAGHVSHIREMQSKFWFGNLRRSYNVKVNVGEIGYEDVDWI